MRTPQELDFDPHVTVLAGRNNVGKTALLYALQTPGRGAFPGLTQAFRMRFSWRLTSAEVMPIFKEAPDAIAHIRGAIESAAEFELVATCDSGVNLTSVPEAGGPFPVGNPMSAGLLLDFEVKVMNLRAELRRQSGVSPPIYGLRWASPPLADSSLGSTPESQTLLARLAGIVANLVRNMYYILPRGIGAKKAAWVPTLELAPDGSNLTTVVATLYTAERRGLFPLLETFLRESFPEIRYLDVEYTGSPPLAEVMIVYDDQGTFKVPLEFCGSGIEQLMALATGVLTSKTPKLMLIDEPHAYLHPYAERSLIKFIRDHREHQYIVATHSGAFMNAFGLKRTRLLTLTQSGTEISSVPAIAPLAVELGLQPTDVWSPRAIAFVEGASEVEIGKVILAAYGIDERGVQIEAMPDIARNAARSPKDAKLLLQFASQMSHLASPLGTKLMFVFDADERKHSMIDDIMQATGGQSTFLPVREIENLLLSAEAIHDFAEQRCLSLGIEPPSLDQVRSDLETLVKSSNDERLYRDQSKVGDQGAIVGSEVLDRLWWAYFTAAYDKVADGPRLAESILKVEPSQLEPFAEVLKGLAN